MRASVWIVIVCLGLVGCAEAARPGVRPGMTGRHDEQAASYKGRQAFYNRGDLISNAIEASSAAIGAALTRQGRRRVRGDDEPFVAYDYLADVQITVSDKSLTGEWFNSWEELDAQLFENGGGKRATLVRYEDQTVWVKVRRLCTDKDFDTFATSDWYSWIEEGDTPVEKRVIRDIECGVFLLRDDHDKTVMETCVTPEGVPVQTTVPALASTYDYFSFTPGIQDQSKFDPLC